LGRHCELGGHQGPGLRDAVTWTARGAWRGRQRAKVASLRRKRQRGDNFGRETERQALQADAAEQQQWAQAADVKPRPPPAEAMNLEVVELSDSAPRPLELGGGKQCVVTATTLPDGNLYAVFTSESAVGGVPVQSKHV
jgi:hypothetical protein